MPKLDLENFKEALAKEPDAALSLSPMSYRRYLAGDFPAAIRWLMRYPRVGRALMKDAEKIPSDVFEELEREAEQRSEKAKAVRDRPAKRTKP